MMKRLARSKATNAYDLLSDVRRVILQTPTRYTQQCFQRRTRDCGTVGCIAYWTERLAGKAIPAPTIAWGVFDVAAARLGLDQRQARHLFYSSAGKGRAGTVAHARAGARHIRAFQLAHAAQLKAQRISRECV